MRLRIEVETVEAATPAGSGEYTGRVWDMEGPSAVLVGECTGGAEAVALHGASVIVQQALADAFLLSVGE